MQPLISLETVAKPSSPSVRLTAFEDPIITKTEKGIKNHPRFTIRFWKKMENINWLYQ